MTSTQRILVIDDDEDMCELITATAESMGLLCTATTAAEEFLAALTPETELILLDLVMPRMDGVELLRILGERRCKAGIILISGIGRRIMETARDLAQARGLSVVGHLEKPFQVEDLEALLSQYTNPSTEPSPRSRSAIVFADAELRCAIERDEFVLYYQPQIDIASRNIVGLEALVRWQHPQHGLIFPDDFIPRIEELKLIDRLGWIVIRRGLAGISQFADRLGNIPLLSLNVSVSSLHDLTFPDTLAALIDGYAIPRQKVILEITESGLIQELTHALDVLTRLRMKHIQLSIDDFGTGYSMMQQLKLIPATELKIDKSFVQNMLERDSDRVMVEKTIEIGHELAMKVIAEGVETIEQLDLLRAYHCDTAQGYLFSRPLPPDELVDWLHAYRSRHGL